MCAVCPRCLITAETNAHVYCCQNSEALKQRTKNWGEFQAQLTKMKTAVLIQQVWAIHLRPLLQLPPSTAILEHILIHTHGDVSFFLRAAIAEQNEIGWDKLLLGMGTTFWQSLQQHIDANNDKPPDRDAADWMNQAVHQLLKFSLRCWKARNVAIHGITYKERQQKALEAVRLKIQQIYEHPPPLAPQFRPITAVSLHQRLRLLLSAAEHWLALIEHQRRVTVHNQKLLMRQHRPIPELMRRMEQEHQRYTRRHSSPSRNSPKRIHSRQVQQDVKAMRMRLYRTVIFPPRPITGNRSASPPRSNEPNNRTHQHPHPRPHPP